jgi:hypothetical protein
VRKPYQNQSTELYLEERLLIKILRECELLGNNDDFLLLKGSSDSFPKCSSVISGLFATHATSSLFRKKPQQLSPQQSPGFW